MVNLEIIAWSLLATIIRVIKDYVKERSVNYAKSFLIVIAGLACAQLFTPYIATKFSLAADMESSLAFIIGLSGKEIVEILLTLNFKTILGTIFNLNSTLPEKVSKDSSKIKIVRKRKPKKSSDKSNLPI